MIAAVLLGFLLIKQFKYLLIYSWMPLIVIGLLIFGIKGTDKNSQGLIYETESAYNYIQVLQQGDYRYLRLNEGQGVHSIYHPTEYFYGGPWSQVLVAPFFNPSSMDPSQVNRIAILGLAAGTTARQASVVYPEAKVDGFEIDPEIIRVGETYFGMRLPNLNAIAEDARWGITKSEQRYDIISVDAYKPPYIPAHMTTVEFFRVVKSHLSPSGVMVINVGRSPLDRDLIDALATTINQVFPKVFITDIPDSFNTMIFATNNIDASWIYFNQNLTHLVESQASDILIKAGHITLLGKVEGFETSKVFTDDLAPIEWMTNKIVLDYVFSEEVTNLE
jgi:spermidine synthase